MISRYFLLLITDGMMLALLPYLILALQTYTKNMPKLIDYPRTTYAGAWELAEVTDDTGGKCAIDTAARKLNRKVSGSFKAIIGSAVKFGLLTSKRDLLTTTTLFKRIKHAYDKQEEILFHREAFLTPPLFTQICRKFRSRELPIQMLDVMLIREFSVEEINAQGVAKAFVEGCKMVGLLNEHNIIADIDALTAQKSPRQELANPSPTANTFRNEETTPSEETQYSTDRSQPARIKQSPEKMKEQFFHTHVTPTTPRPAATNATRPTGPDAIASLFGLSNNDITEEKQPIIQPTTPTTEPTAMMQPTAPQPVSVVSKQVPAKITHDGTADYQIQINGPGINTNLSISEEEDISLAIALLEKIRRQLRT